LYYGVDRSVVIPTQEGRPTVQLTSRQVRVEIENKQPPTTVEKAAGRPLQEATSRSAEDDIELSNRPRPPADVRRPAASTRTLVGQPAYPKAKPGVPASRPAAPKPTGTASPSIDPKPAGPPPDWRREIPDEPGQGGENGTQSNVTRRARPLSQPEFNLTRRFPDLDSVQVKARFDIAEDGSYEPTLLSTTGNPTADVVILGKLLEYKWLPAMDKGVPVKDSRVLDISLEG
jgi:hypothetical protein